MHHEADKNSMNSCQLIPEQFTVKAHPALFEGEGREGQKSEEHFVRNTFPSKPINIISLLNSQLTKQYYFTGEY